MIFFSSLLLILGKTISIFFLIFFEFLIKGPIFLKIKQPKLDEFFNPIILKIIKKSGFRLFQKGEPPARPGQVSQARRPGQPAQASQPSQEASPARSPLSQFLRLHCIFQKHVFLKLQCNSKELRRLAGLARLARPGWGVPFVKESEAWLLFFQNYWISFWKS